MTELIFGRTGWTIAFHDCDDLAHQVPRVLHGWRLRVDSTFPPASDDAVAYVSRKQDHWTWRPAKGFAKPRDWNRVPPRSAIRVLTDIHDAALHWYLAEHRHLLCLHAAAVQVGQSLLCFPARGFAGKSTLVASLAALGHQVFADDVIGLAGARCTAMAMGFSPRLRTPLPAEFPSALRTFMANHAGPSGPGWTYLELPPAQQAPLGTRHPVDAIIVLERQAGAVPVLAELGQAAALKLLLAENITRKLPMPEIFTRYERLSRQTRRYTLTYDDPVHAARLISREFS